MELSSLPTNVIWMSIIMMVPAAIAAGVVLTGITMYFVRKLMASGQRPLRDVRMSLRTGADVATDMAARLSRPVTLERRIARVSGHAVRAR